MPILKIAFIHGWGLNSAIWQDLVDQLDAQVVLIDIPGYGRQEAQDSSADLQELASACLEQVAEPALWVGWSLGGMIAMQAAIQDQQGRVAGLQLINSTPRFVHGLDWQHGVHPSVFLQFCDGLVDDYQQSLKSFLLLQTGSSQDSRSIAKLAATAISQYSAPSQQTLQLGVDCLRNSDLRSKLVNIRVPTQVICGRLDRVTAPQSSYYLAEQMQAELIDLNSGHALFLTHPEEYLQALFDHLSIVSAEP